MAISRKPRNQSQTEDNVFEAPTAQLFEDVDNEDNNNKEPQDDRYDQLAKTLADVQARLIEAERTNMTLMTTQRHDEVYVPAGDPNKIKLPDPAIDPDGFAASVQQRNELLIENKRREDAYNSKRQQDLRDKVDNLWEEFAKDYPSMAADQERIDYVASKVANEARSRGIDVERYMFVTRHKFLEDVAEKYTDIFGEPEEDDTDIQEETNRRFTRKHRSSADTNSRRRTSRRDRQEDNYVERTGGIFGGNESGGRAFSRNEETGPDMIDDIHAIQRKTGFF